MRLNRALVSMKSQSVSSASCLSATLKFVIVVVACEELMRGGSSQAASLLATSLAALIVFFMSSVTVEMLSPSLFS